MKPLVAQGGEQLLHAALVALFRGADEVVVGEAESVPQAAKLAGDGGGKFLRACARPARRSARSFVRARRCR